MRSHPCGQAGSLLMVTLWLVVMLSVLTVAIARYLSVDLRLTRYRLSQTQAKMLAHSGIFLAMQRLMDDTTPGHPAGDAVDWLGDEWALPPEAASDDPTTWMVQLPTGSAASGLTRTLAVRISDEERRLNLNIAEPETLMRLGIPEGIAQAIADYRDPADVAEEHPTRVPPYVPKNAPFAVLEELHEIPGMGEETLQVLQHATSPWLATSSRVNINTADRETLEAIGLSRTLVDAIIAFRERGHYFLRLAPSVEAEHPTAPVPFEPSQSGFQNVRARLGVASEIFRIVSEGVVEGRVTARVRVEAVVRRSADGSRPTVLAWREG